MRRRRGRFLCATTTMCFLKGHRIMVQVAVHVVPLIDRNPQKFVKSIY